MQLLGAAAAGRRPRTPALLLLVATTTVAVLLATASVQAAQVRLVLTGDVNLNPELPPGKVEDPAWVWGGALPFLRSADALAINHEATLAGVVDSDPATIQFEDPLHYLATYGPKGADVSFVSNANNHQFDFHESGAKTTLSTLDGLGIPHGGLASTAAAVRTPTVIKVSPKTKEEQGEAVVEEEEEEEGGAPLEVAFFTMVVDECFRWDSNGSKYLDGCTCGPNAGPPPAYQCQTAGKNASAPLGSWYNWGITDAFISEASSVVRAYSQAHPEQLIVTFLHCGPNFQWHPYPQHENLLRNLSVAGADIVWGTSSHHVQRFEWFGNEKKPIIYGLGDLLFRHTPGVDDFCPIYARPCAQYRPELGLAYAFTVDYDDTTTKTAAIEQPSHERPRRRRRPTVAPTATALGTRHTPHQTFPVSQDGDTSWLVNIFNELSSPFGATLSYTGKDGLFTVAQSS